jgi:hypothetical protein
MLPKKLAERVSRHDADHLGNSWAARSRHDAHITGPNLADTYQHYFGTKFPAPPPPLTDPYEISNWRDCKMTAALWTRWQRGELMSYV